MRLLITIVLPVDAVDETDATDACLDLLACAVGKGRAQTSSREWLRENATVTITPNPEGNAQ